MISNRRNLLKLGAFGAVAGVMPAVAVRAKTAAPAAGIADTTLDLVDPQYRAFAQQMLPAELSDAILPQIREVVAASPAIGRTDPVYEHFDIAGRAAEVYVYRPSAPKADPAPAILYIHGGGYVVGTAGQMHGYCHDMADKSGAVVVSVEYRLAPDTPFPGPLEDCHDALSWTHARAADLGIDPDRISIMGHSAGGGLCAALALYARDRGEMPVRAQFPIYPMLDHRTATTAAPVNNLATGEFVWGRQTNRYGWASYRGGYGLDDARIGHFSPTHAAALAGLPPAFMIVGALDLFLEEDADYALRLTRERVPVEFIIYPGAIHGFDNVPGTNLTARFEIDLYNAFARFI
ncbi:alpha/beta hydrolase [Oricola sp.]|uniref:alpha/beta hydrolase n=1 Tax=Oricola sp. TaxID=1979950 RepID=UPI003BA9E2AB